MGRASRRFVQRAVAPDMPAIATKAKPMAKLPLEPDAARQDAAAVEIETREESPGECDRMRVGGRPH